MRAQRRLRSAWASAQTDQSSLCAQWVAKDSIFLHADSKHSDQTGQMPRLIRVFAGRTCHFVTFVMRWHNDTIVKYRETFYGRNTAHNLSGNEKILNKSALERNRHPQTHTEKLK